MWEQISLSLSSFEETDVNESDEKLGSELFEAFVIFADKV